MIVEGSVLPIPRANIDTDQIIPAHYLTRIDADGMGEHLFEGMPDGVHLLRYTLDIDARSQATR